MSVLLFGYFSNSIQDLVGVLFVLPVHSRKQMFKSQHFFQCDYGKGGWYTENYYLFKPLKLKSSSRKEKKCDRGGRMELGSTPPAKKRDST